jgi:hypothetical protein
MIGKRRRDRQRVGFWYPTKEDAKESLIESAFGRPLDDDMHLPHVEAFIDQDWDSTERERIAVYLKRGRVLNSYKGWSTCRLCKKHNGSTDLGDDKWLWPEGFAHYVRDHAVKPHEEFLNHVRITFRSASSAPIEGKKMLDPNAIVDSFTGEYAFLSNFYPVEILYDGYVYKHVEGAYQAAKTTSKHARRMIRVAETPGKAKRAGRQITLRSGWEKIKIRIMTELVYQKFTTNPKLAKKLLETGSTKLIEGNTWGDRYWGVDVKSGVGENHLGKILMLVREHLGNLRTVLSHL